MTTRATCANCSRELVLPNSSVCVVELGTTHPIIGFPCHFCDTYTANDGYADRVIDLVRASPGTRRVFMLDPRTP